MNLCFCLASARLAPTKPFRNKIKFLHLKFKLVSIYQFFAEILSGFSLTCTHCTFQYFIHLRSFLNCKNCNKRMNIFAFHKPHWPPNQENEDLTSFFILGHFNRAASCQILYLLPDIWAKQIFFQIFWLKFGLFKIVVLKPYKMNKKSQNDWKLFNSLHELIQGL